MGPCHDPDYVADPGEGPRRDRGCVVDLTLTDGNGEELLMPPNFEDSSERTGHDYEGPVRRRHTQPRPPARGDKEHGFERFKLPNLPLENVP